MGVKRYELSEAQWARIAQLLPGKAGDPGRTGADNRLFVNGVLWVLRTGAAWHDLPRRYPPYQTCHRRFQQWQRSGRLDRLCRWNHSIAAASCQTAPCHEAPAR